MNPAVLADLESSLVPALGSRWVRKGTSDLRAYAYDATGPRHLPDLVVFPADQDQVVACVRAASRHRVPVIPRGAGTGVSGGALPVTGGVVMSLTRMNRVLCVNPDARFAVVEPGVTNEQVQLAVRQYGLFFPPDPSSMRVATLGGGIAENAGGPRCAKYGVTANHVMGATIVMWDGTIVHVGGKVEDTAGLDLLGFIIGSEGTLGIVTEAILRLTPLPRAYRTILTVFDDLATAMAAVSAVVAAGIIPAAMELIDRNLLELIRASTKSSLPSEAAAVVLIDVDGDPEEIDPQVACITKMCLCRGAVDSRVAENAEEREELWAARRAAAGSLSRVSPSQLAMDITVPRDCLQSMMEEVVEIADKYGLKVCGGGHVGDGNLHPAVPYDPHSEQQRVAIERFDWEVQRASLRYGGSVTGEHGIGIEKLRGLACQYSPEVLRQMQAVRRAFDPFTVFNPGKALPRVVSA